MARPLPYTALYLQDNQSTIHWAHGRDNFARTKHINVKYHFVRELVESRSIDVVYKPTTIMIADILTKPLITGAYDRLSKLLLGE